MFWSQSHILDFFPVEQISEYILLQDITTCVLTGNDLKSWTSDSKRSNWLENRKRIEQWVKARKMTLKYIICCIHLLKNRIFQLSGNAPIIPEYCMSLRKAETAFYVRRRELRCEIKFGCLQSTDFSQFSGPVEASRWCGESGRRRA